MSVHGERKKTVYVKLFRLEADDDELASETARRKSSTLIKISKVQAHGEHPPTNFSLKLSLYHRSHEGLRDYRPFYYYVILGLISSIKN